MRALIIHIRRYNILKYLRLNVNNKYKKLPNFQALKFLAWLISRKTFICMDIELPARRHHKHNKSNRAESSSVTAHSRIAHKAQSFYTILSFALLLQIYIYVYTSDSAALRSRHSVVNVFTYKMCIGMKLREVKLGQRTYLYKMCIIVVE